MNRFIAAAVQMVSSPSVSANLREAEQLIQRAAEAGARLVVLPENFAFMGMNETDKLDIAEREGSGPIQDFLARSAENHRVWIVGGTLPLQAGERRVHASCLVYDDAGEKIARYDKIHLFDVHVPGTNEQYLESNIIEAGENPLIIDSPFGGLGVAICYDIRFPELFREMADRGLDVLAVPSAFTAQTGAAHWELLVRARAVENLCYTVAADQGGYHVNGRETYGHSMIVDPWGKVLSSLTTEAGIATAECEPERLRQVRAAFPALQHRRLRRQNAATPSNSINR
jgi:predicted amidohydrolase